MDYRVIKAISDLDKQKVFVIRKEVFVIEQNVPEKDEFDEFEDDSHHFVALDEKDEPIGSGRWRCTSKGVKLERFTVKKYFRNKGIGTVIVQTVMDDISQKKEKGILLYMYAQINAIPLYLKFGFKVEGDQFDECGIRHQFMWKKL